MRGPAAGVAIRVDSGAVNDVALVAAIAAEELRRRETSLARFLVSGNT